MSTNRIYIASVGYVEVSDHWGKSIGDLMVEAGLQAMRATPSIRPDGIIIGNMFSALSSSQEHLGALAATGLDLVGVPAFKVEAACASGAIAANVGYSQVKTGQSEAVLVIGVEKMRDLEQPDITSALSIAESAEYTQYIGASFVALNALLAQIYLEKYNVTRDELSAFPVLAHTNALTSKHAQFRKPITVDDVSKSALISDPLRLLDCAPVGDGAAALLLTNESRINDVSSYPVEVAASSASTNVFSVYERDDMLEFNATKQATKKAFEEAKIDVQDVDTLEFHDAFSVTGALSVEAMGFSKPGEGAKDAAIGKFSSKGEIPSQTFGGLKGRGHPVGATGIYQIAELWHQLSGKAGDNQIQDPEIGVAQNMGGIDTTSVITVLKRRK